MSSSGKAKKTKWKSIAFEEVLPNAVIRPTTSWAEEVENELKEYTIKKISTINLPTAPRAVCDLVIDESKIPPNGPFMAYLSNLPFEITEDDISQQFKELKIAGIQLPKDNRYDRMKGFGYVEFKDKSSLITALREGELTIKGRSVRISLPNEDEQQKDKGSRSSGVSFSRRDVSDRIEGNEKTLGEWRAAAPIPHDPDKSSGFTRLGQRENTGGSGGGGVGGFRENRGFDSESSSSFSRGFRERDREFDRSSDRGSDRIFGKRYERDDRGGNRMAFGRRYDREREDRDFKRFTSATEKDEPKSRPKLEIQPRTKPLDTNKVPDALPSSIFGGAKPVDTLKREMEIEAKLSMAAVATQPSRSRGSSPPPRSATPLSNRSRSSSVSSMSSCRRQNTQTNESANESQRGEHSDGERERIFKKPESVRTVETKEPLPFPSHNFWEQRKAANAATSEIALSDTLPVIEKSITYDNLVDISENRSRVEEVVKPNESITSKKEDKNESSSVSSSNTSYNYNVELDSTNTTDLVANSESSQYSGRQRYVDNKPNYGRDNRNDRRENRRDSRRLDNNSQPKRDDNRFISKPDKRNFGNKTRNNGPGGSKKYLERDNGYSGSGFRDKNDGRSVADCSNRPSSISSATNLGEDGESRRFHDERLTESDSLDEKYKNQDERVKIVDDNANKKTIENGNENGQESENVRESSENATFMNDQSEINEEAFSSGKNRKIKRTRKKDEKKKIIERLDNEQMTNEKDNERQAKNQKDDKKKADIQVVDKISNKTNTKNKEKSLKKNRDDISQMPKMKEEKAPNFQDSNRFFCLENDD